MAEEKKEPKKIDAITILAYLGILFLVPFFLKKDDEFAKFHAKQGFVLFLAEIVASFFMFIPFIGWVIGDLIWLACVILMIIGIINVATNKKEPLPVIGKYADRFKF